MNDTQVVTQEILDSNPDLVKAGVKVGDPIVTETEVKNAPAPAPNGNKPASINLEEEKFKALNSEMELKLAKLDEALKIQAELNKPKPDLSKPLPLTRMSLMEYMTKLQKKNPEKFEARREELEGKLTKLTK